MSDATLAVDAPSPTSVTVEASGVPMPEAQVGLWYAQRLDPANPSFNTAQYVDIRGDLHVAALCSAVDVAMQESGALRVRAHDSADGPMLSFDPDNRAALEVVDLSDESDPEAAARRLMSMDQQTPVDPQSDPLVAQRLYILSAERRLWYQRIHHLVIDGYGTSLLTARICELYAALVAGGASGAPLVPFAAVVAADAAYRRSERRDADRAFWLNEFADRPVAARISDGPPLAGHSSHSHSIQLPGTPARLLGDLAARASATWPDAVVALCAAYLARHTRGKESIIGVPSMNRLGSPAARVPSMVMNVLPLRVPVDEDQAISELVADVARRQRLARRHGRYRGEQIRRDLGLAGSDRWLHGPLVNVLPFDAPAVLLGLDTTMHTLCTGPVDDLTITVRGDGIGSELRLEVEGNPGLYTLQEVTAHAHRLAHFLGESARAERLADVQTLTPAEFEHWTRGVNDTGHQVEGTTLTALLERAVRGAPDAPALVEGNRTLSYGELDLSSNAMVRSLHEAGVRRGDIVAVAVPRSMDMLVSLVAVLRAGAAYLPLDPEQPAFRTESILASAQPRAILAVASVQPALPSTDLPIILVDGVSARTAPDAPRVVSAADDAAYVIYTSGSTGEPKGVVVEHRAIVNRLQWMREHYGFDSTDRVLQKTPTTFDVSVWELFLPLIAGGTLVIAPPGAHRDPAALATLVREHGVTTAHFVPSMLALFLDEPLASGLELRRVLCSGEALPPTLRDRFHQVIRAELHNLYGPTEAAVDVTFWNASAGDSSNPVPIGHPVWNTRMYVLDERLRPLPPGVAGDLYIAGAQLARGYLGRDDLTSERFVPDPFGPEGSRMYLTGDLARWRGDGALEFLGRTDHQVKLRGQRVELGEIETALEALPEVVHAAVVLREERVGDQRLVAYVTPVSPGVELDTAAIRASLAARLPEYMVPSALVTLAELPLTSSGKLDRRALPAPSVETAAVGRAPASGTEVALAELFADVLGVPQATVGADDDFFTMGGHSLLAARVAAHLRANWGRDVGLGALFAHPTVARLAALLDGADVRQWQSSGTRDLSDLGLGPSIHLSLTADYGAPRLFCVHPAGGISWCYAPLARALGPRFSLSGLQARGLDLGESIPGSLSELAAEYVSLLRAERPRGPYHLLGWSAGGIIAHEMAVQLRELGDEVGLLALLDAYPSELWRNQPEPDEGAVLRALLHIAGQDPATLAGDLTRASVVAHLRRLDHPLGELHDDVLTGVVRVVESSNRMVRGHYHRRYDGALLHFRAALDHEGDGLSPLQWEPYASSVEVHDVPSLHAHMTSADASVRIASVLRGRL